MLGAPKTILFNFRYLPLRQAIHLPVLVSHRVAFLGLRGTVALREPARFASVWLGFGTVNFKRERSVWRVNGTVVFDGPARLGNGFHLVVEGEITFGPDFVLTGPSQIVAVTSVTFGADCLMSWGVLILDTDGHGILGADGAPKPRESPIVIGDHVWLGTRATVLKGVHLGDGIVIAAGAMVARSELESGVLIGGVPARVLRRDVRWER